MNSAKDNSSSNIFKNCAAIVEGYRTERNKEYERKGPNSFPKESFDPVSMPDVHAYYRVNPNFWYKGDWYSKKRYVHLRSTKGDFIMRLKDKVILDHPQDEPSHWDHVNWNALHDQYMYWRRRFRKDHRLYGKD